MTEVLSAISTSFTPTSSHFRAPDSPTTKRSLGTQTGEKEETFEGKPLSQLFPEERRGWRGYVEWELAPERKKAAEEVLKTKNFTPIPGSSFLPNVVNCVKGIQAFHFSRVRL